MSEEKEKIQKTIVVEEVRNLPVKFISVEEEKIKKLLEINHDLRRQLDEMNTDLANIFASSIILSKNVDFKKPWKAIAFLADLVKNPKKFEPILKPMSDVLEKHKDLRDQIEKHYDKMLAEKK